jgi:hypothetical protein
VLFTVIWVLLLGALGALSWHLSFMAGFTAEYRQERCALDWWGSVTTSVVNTWAIAAVAGSVIVFSSHAVMPMVSKANWAWNHVCAWFQLFLNGVAGFTFAVVGYTNRWR